MRSSVQFIGWHSPGGSKFDAGVAGRAPQCENFPLGKRRAGFGRGGKAMDGRKRAGSMTLGREASRTAKRGFANRRTSLVVVSFMAGCNAARVHTSNYVCDMTKNDLRPLRNQSMNCKFFVTQFRWPRTTCSPDE